MTWFGGLVLLLTWFVGLVLLLTWLMVYQMTQHNVGALVVVKPGEEKSIAGIITERGNKITVHFNCVIMLSKMGMCTVCHLFVDLCRVETLF